MPIIASPNCVITFEILASTEPRRELSVELAVEVESVPVTVGPGTSLVGVVLVPETMTEVVAIELRSVPCRTCRFL